MNYGTAVSLKTKDIALEKGIELKSIVENLARVWIMEADWMIGHSLNEVRKVTDEVGDYREVIEDDSLKDWRKIREILVRNLRGLEGSHNRRNLGLEALNRELVWFSL